MRHIVNVQLRENNFEPAQNCLKGEIFIIFVTVPGAYMFRAYTLRFPLYVTIFEKFSKIDC